MTRKSWYAVKSTNQPTNQPTNAKLSADICAESLHWAIEKGKYTK